MVRFSERWKPDRQSPHLLLAVQRCFLVPDIQNDFHSSAVFFFLRTFKLKWDRVWVSTWTQWD
jgi:hypothetical protein